MAKKKNQDAPPVEYSCLKLPLICYEQDRGALDKIMRAHCTVKNNLIAKCKRKLEQLERARAWKDRQKELSELYAISEKERTPEQKVRLKELCAERSAVLKDNGFTEYGFDKLMTPIRYPYKHLVKSAVAKNLASDVWKMFESYLYGKGDAIHFTRYDDFVSFAGKTNGSSIRYRDGIVYVGKRPFKVKLSRNDKYSYEAQMLSNEVVFCKISREPREWGWCYFVQLVFKCPPAKKLNPETGEFRTPLGEGRVGIDIGPQTVAVVSDSGAHLEELADKVPDMNREKRRILRAMDRSRRATNPDMFAEDGSIVPVNRLPAHCLTRKKRRKWVKSKRYLALEQKLRAINHKMALMRRLQHNEAANRFLREGNTFYIESMRFAALAKRAKETTVNEKTGRFRSKRRYGRSISNKAPATFVNILEQKVLRMGGQFYRINTWQAKASQFNHITHDYVKKSLSKRWNHMPDGRRIQRDLYSAFLIQNCNESLDGFVQELCDANYENFVKLHDAEITRLQEVVIVMPCSMGIKREKISA